ncbi:MAG: DUF262 domain-containing protein [Eubacteriales bacterium]
MAYSIVESSVKDFIDNASNIKLPRFQRKQTWTKEQNFKLCISVFKEYPVGVVILNHSKDADWLLDGRQRRNALKLMREDFVSVYEWARSFIKFTASDSDEEVKEKFWRKIDIYLQKEFEAIEEEDEEDSDEENADSFDAQSQYNSLLTLQDIILVVHGKKTKGHTKFEHMFLFDGIVDAKDLSYVIHKDGQYICDPVKLRKKILESIEEDNIDKESFFENLLKYRVTEECEKELKEHLSMHWDYYDRCINVVKRSEAVISKARLGMIKLYNATVLDAQNIFSLVNAGGTKLTGEELLSARPFWNVPVTSPSGAVRDEVLKLYQKLGIDVPDDVYRWDFGATLLSRIDRKNLIFDELPLEVESSLGKRMSLGFKLLSAIYLGGITNNDVTMLENTKKVNIDWNVDIDKLVQELNIVIDVISDASYFRYFAQWNKSIMSVTTHAVAQEFITIMYRRWKELGKPNKANAGSGSVLAKEAVVLYDKLVYEYSVRLWKGSSDSRLARDLKNISERLSPIKTEQWISLIEELSSGTYNGTEVKVDAVKALIYHYCSIKEFQPVVKDLDTIYEIDHIVAQNIFNKSQDMINMNLKNSITNLSPLPKSKNIEKLDKPLKMLTDVWLKREIKRYTGFNDDDLIEFSNINNIEKMRDKRLKEYIDAFDRMRSDLFAN